MEGGLKDEIKQSKPFSSIKEELWLSILRTAASVSHDLEAKLRPRGLSLTQYNVLRILRGAPEGLCQYEIRERLVAQVPDVPRILDRMEKGGVIQRVRGEADRRMVIATLTDVGQHLVDDLDAPMEDWMSGLFDTLDEAEMRVLVVGLARARGVREFAVEVGSDRRTRVSELRPGAPT